MAYAAETDLDNKWGAEAVTLAAFDTMAQARSETRIAAALDAASALMDGYFCKRYALPIDAAPNGVLLLRNLCCDLAMGELSKQPGTRNDIVVEAVASRAQIPRSRRARPRRHSAKSAAWRAGVRAAVAQRSHGPRRSPHLLAPRSEGDVMAGVSFEITPTGIEAVIARLNRASHCKSTN